MARRKLATAIGEALDLAEQLKEALNTLPTSIRENVAELAIQTIRKRGRGRPPGTKTRKTTQPKKRKKKQQAQQQSGG
ncbi:MAG: hypothetical protein NXY59_03930 [Aigarchaeota archaeon]|nr:hypothetical protein [Candidatus Pelearchaeum maunauluense]